MTFLTILHTVSVILIQKTEVQRKISDFFSNLLKLRPRSSHLLFTRLEVTSQKKKHFRRKVTIRVKTRNCKILHQYRRNRSSRWVFQSNKKEGIKVFRGIISVIIERGSQGQFSSSSDYQYTETRSKNTSTLLWTKIMGK